MSFGKSGFYKEWRRKKLGYFQRSEFQLPEPVFGYGSEDRSLGWLSRVLIWFVIALILFFVFKVLR